MLSVFTFVLSRCLVALLVNAWQVVCQCQAVGACQIPKHPDKLLQAHVILNHPPGELERDKLGWVHPCFHVFTEN